jgi:hypothetical protein
VNGADEGKRNVLLDAAANYKRYGKYEEVGLLPMWLRHSMKRLFWKCCDCDV